TSRCAACWRRRRPAPRPARTPTRSSSPSPTDARSGEPSMMFRRALAAVVMFGAAQAAWAASGFGVSPLRLDLSASKPMASYTLTNSGDTPVVIQAQPRAWRQEHGRDVLGDTRAFLVNPAI